MVWTTVLRKEKSDFNDNELVYFDFFGEEKYVILSDKVLKYVKQDSVNVGDMIFVIKSFSNGNVRYLLKNVRR